MNAGPGQPERGPQNADLAEEAVLNSTGNGQTRRSVLVWAAWLSVAAIPVGFIAASLLGGLILGAAGYGDQDARPLAVTLLAGIPALLVQLLPAALGVWLGASATNHGDRRGRLPMRIALIVGLTLLTLNLFSLLLNVLLGSRAAATAFGELASAWAR